MSSSAFRHVLDHSLLYGPLLGSGAYSTTSKLVVVTAAISFAVLYNIAIGIYNVYFHPLSKFPGPKLAAAFKLYEAFYTVRGQSHKMFAKLHERYGEVVRYSPDSLSIINETAWHDIYMARHPQMRKSTEVRPVNGAHSIVFAPDDIHARQRKVLAHAFSEKALREQEPLIQTYMDLLVKNLREDAEASTQTNITAELNYLTFDLIGDLTFASPFNALRNREEHPWMTNMFKSIYERTIMGALLEFPIFFPFLALFAGSLKKGSMRQMEYCLRKVKERIEQGAQRPDFMAQVLKNNDLEDTSKGMTRAEIDITFNTLMSAGSETTATTLSGCMYLLAKNKRVAEKLKTEVREAFGNGNEISVVKTNQLSYLLAVIEEALRIYPPVPVPLSRRTPAEGASICGQWVPGNTVVGIPQFAANSSPVNFTSPEEFLPERFFPQVDERYAGDRKAIYQPFSAGPRNCVGRNLAYSEMKLALCRIVYDFDFELVDEGDDWLDQKVYGLWDKKPLMMRFMERKSG
ncbi:putative secreted glycosidase [Venturia nashicola]|uniref:Putative secreted glycosidase n=1 Tax=Venturia nashicola TaxID=86259 RepID=A0A4Z1PN46_9PEZI|nr:putative secreted glycosidase [Venturia nashicola]